MLVSSPRIRLLLESLVFWTCTSAATPSDPSQEGSIVWGSCHRNLSIPLLCATLDVPLDYTATGSNASMLTLKLVKSPSTRQPSQGSILISPGGPGIGGRNFMVTNGASLQEYGQAFGDRASALGSPSFHDANRALQDHRREFRPGIVGSSVSDNFRGN
jgi:hypothetical protein